MIKNKDLIDKLQLSFFLQIAYMYGMSQRVWLILVSRADIGCNMEKDMYHHLLKHCNEFLVNGIQIDYMTYIDATDATVGMLLSLRYWSVVA